MHINTKIWMYVIRYNCSYAAYLGNIRKVKNYMYYWRIILFFFLCQVLNEKEKHAKQRERENNCQRDFEEMGSLPLEIGWVIHIRKDK